MATLFGGREPQTDFLETAADRGMFNLIDSWPDDDPHPLDKMALNADNFISGYGKNQSGTGNIVPDMAKINRHLDFGLTPTNNAPRKELMPFNTHVAETDNNNLWEKAALSIGAGDHADGNHTTSQYHYINSPDAATIKRDETFSEARQRSQEITQPTANMDNLQKTLSAIATRNQQKGFEMEQPMGMFVEKNGSPIYQESQDAESRFSYEVPRAWGEMTGENWPEMTKSAHNADASYQKHFGDDPERYRAFINRMAQPGPQSIRDAREIEGSNIGKNAMNLRQGGSVTYNKAANEIAQVFMMAGSGLEKATGLNLINPLEWAQEIYDRKNLIKTKMDELVQWDNIHVPGQPDKTLENMQSFCYQSVFGRYSFDLAALYLTRGWGIAGNTAIRMFDAASDLYVQDLVENGNDDFVGSLQRGFQVGGTVGLTEHMLTALTKGVDPYSRMALQFLIKNLSDKEQETLLNRVIQEQANKQQRQ